jgi:hypothetical protein
VTSVKTQTEIGSTALFYWTIYWLEIGQLDDFSAVWLALTDSLTETDG